jgi:hypothetical protein
MILITDGNKEINTAQHGPQPSYDIITYILSILLLRRKDLKTPKTNGVPILKQNFVQ